MLSPPPSPPAPTPPTLDHHVKEVIELRQKRQRIGHTWAARVTPFSIDPHGTAVANMAAGSKVVHFVRHGEAQHNALAAVAGAKCGCKRRHPEGRDQPQAECPYNAPTAMDAPLTPVGLEQARKLAGTTAAARGVELVASSPLRRTLQTSLHAFADASIPIVAHEDLREQIGMHQCDRRRDTAAIREEFGARVDLRLLRSTDELWTSQREQKDSVADRCVRFVDWLMRRPETTIAVAAHHHVLLVLFHCVLETDEADLSGLRKPFAVGEMRTVHLSPSPQGRGGSEAS